MGGSRITLLRQRGQDGIAMMMTVIIIMVAASLAAVILVQGSSTDRHSDVAVDRCHSERRAA